MAAPPDFRYLCRRAVKGLGVLHPGSQINGHMLAVLAATLLYRANHAVVCASPEWSRRTWRPGGSRLLANSSGQNGIAGCSNRKHSWRSIPLPPTAPYRSAGSRQTRLRQCDRPRGQRFPNTSNAYLIRAKKIMIDLVVSDKTVRLLPKRCACGTGKTGAAGLPFFAAASGFEHARAD